MGTSRTITPPPGFEPLYEPMPAIQPPPGFEPLMVGEEGTPPALEQPKPQMWTPLREFVNVLRLGQTLKTGVATGAGTVISTTAGTLEAVNKAAAGLGLREDLDEGELADFQAMQDFGKKLQTPRQGFWESFSEPQKQEYAGEWALKALAEQVPIMGSMAVAGRLAGQPGAFAVSYLINAGDHYLSLKEKGVDSPIAALAAGIPISLLETFSLVRVGGKLVFKAVEEAGGSLLKKAGTEAGTEALQDVLAAGSEAVQGVGDSLPQTLVRMLNAGVEGGMAGGVFGGAVNLVQADQRPGGAIPELEDFGVPGEPQTEETLPPEPPPNEEPSAEGSEPVTPTVDDDTLVEQQMLAQIRAMPDAELGKALEQIQDDFAKKAVEIEQQRRELGRQMLTLDESGAFDDPKGAQDKLATLQDVTSPTQDPGAAAEVLKQQSVLAVNGKASAADLQRAEKVMEEAWASTRWDSTYLRKIGEADRMYAEADARIASPQPGAAFDLQAKPGVMNQAQVGGPYAPTSGDIVQIQDSPRTTSGVSVVYRGKKDAVETPEQKSIREAFASSDFADNFGKALTDSYEIVKSIYSRVKDVPHPFVNRIGDFVPGVAMTVGRLNLFGEFLPTRKDLTHAVVGISPFSVKDLPRTVGQGSKGATWLKRPAVIETPRDLATQVFETLLHEGAHLMALHPAKEFDTYLNKIFEQVTPEEANAIIERIENAYSSSPKSSEFSADALKWWKRINGAEPIRGSQANDIARQPAVARGTTDSGLSSTTGGPANAPPTAEDTGGGDAGSEPAGVGREARGDWPPVEPGYDALIQRLFEVDRDQYFHAAEPDGPEVEDFKASIKNVVPADVARQVSRAVAFFNKWLARSTTIIQISQKYPQWAELSKRLQILRDYWRTKTTVTMEADDVLRQWQKVWGAPAQKLTDFIFDTTLDSDEKKRRFTRAELAQMAKAAGLNSRQFQLYLQIDKSLRDALLKIRQGMVDEAIRRFGPLATPFLHQIKADFDRMLNRNYFPLTRFGRHTVYAVATGSVTVDGKRYRKGQTVFFGAEETKYDQGQTFAELKKKWGALKNLSIGVDYIRDDTLAGRIAPFSGFSPALLDLLVPVLGLSMAQIKQGKELVYKLAPGQAFVKHLKRRRGVSGYSRDALRAYADYMQHASNHLARLRHREDLERNLQGLIDRGKAASGDEKLKIQEAVELLAKHQLDLMTPSNDLAWIRGALFAWMMGGVPKQLLMNATQLPIFGLSYLAKNHKGNTAEADVYASWQIAKALKDTLHFRKARLLGSPEEESFMRWALKQGFIKQSFASEVAAAAQAGSGFLRMRVFNMPVDYFMRRTVEWSTGPFQWSEEQIRRAMALASYRMARDHMALPINEARLWAQKAVDNTMFEYSAWNRPEIMRGKKAVLFVFRSFLQHSIYFAATGQGGAQWWLMMLAMAGLKGLPGADDVMDLIDLLGTWGQRLFGYHAPKVDAEKALREMMTKVAGEYGDTLVTGAARETLGLTALNHLFTHPIVPAIDFSGSMSLGRIVNIEPLVRMSQGGDFGQNMVELAGGILGAGSTTGMNMMRAVMDDTPASAKWLRAMPVAVKNVMRAWDMAQRKQVTDSRGRKVMDVDTSKPEQIGEIIGQLLGSRPTRATKEQEAYWSASEERQYYLASREVLFTGYALAYANKEPEQLKDMLRAIQEFNRDAPAPVRITSAQLVDSVRARVLGQSMRALGLPTQRSYQPLYQEYRKLYGLPVSVAGEQNK